MKKYLFILALLAFPFVSHGAYFTSVSIDDGNYLGKKAELTPMSQLRTTDTYRLIGSVFIDGLPGGDVDSNFWATTTVSNASSTQEYGAVKLQTGTSANASTSIQSNRTARYVGANANMYRAQVQLGDTGTTNNIRRWGAFSTTDGAFFQLSTTTFSVCTRRASVDTCTNSPSFNGTIPTLTTNVTTYEIYYTNGTVYFTMSDALVHKFTASSQTWASTMNLPVRAENGNYNGGTGDSTMFVRVMTISRLGPIETAPMWKHITGAVTAQVLKTSAGRLHNVILGTQDSAGTLTLYDARTATNIISSMKWPVNQPPTTMTFDLDFYDGLTVTTTGASTDFTLVYE